MAMPDNRPYFEVVEKFLREIQNHKVTSLCLVALIDDKETHDFVAKWKCGPLETITAAGVLQLHASLQYHDVNYDDDDEEEDD